MSVHYSADPSKRDPNWIRTEKAAMGERQWRQQMEMDEDVYDGEPVFPEFMERSHIFEAVAQRSGMLPQLPVFEQSIWLGGWDTGNTLNPAFVLLQLTVEGQVLAMSEVVPTRPMAMEQFCPMVNQHLRMAHPKVPSVLIKHFGDETGRNRMGNNGESAFGVAKRHGFVIRPVSNIWEGRRSAVSWVLTDCLEGPCPRALFSRLSCPTLVEGFLGAYKLRTSNLGDDSGPGAVYSAPLKNSFSHVQDAYQYPVVVIHRHLSRGVAMVGTGGKSEKANPEKENQQRLNAFLDR